MTAVVPQAANEQGASSANLRHTWTDYWGNFIYENDTLKQTLIEGGYVSYEYPQNTAVTSISQLAPTYHFYVQDHLGNNRLVVDLGGQHAKASGGVSLDTLGLVVGEAYPFHIFYAERHTASSNFVLETSINLRPDPNLCSD